MVRKSELAGISLAVLAMVMALLMLGGEQRTMAVYWPPVSAALEPAPAPQEMSHTVSLPIVVRRHDPSYLSPFGVVMYGAVDDAAGLQEMKRGGARWAATVLSWLTIEPNNGIYNWSSFDTKAQNAQAAGIDLFVLFNNNPTWAAEMRTGPVYVDKRQDLVDFVTRMAERYDCDGVEDAPGSPCVHYWSFYAEPDNGDRDYAERTGKGYWGYNGAGYAAMLAQVSPAIHRANSRAKVLIGGLAYDNFEEDGGPFVRSFLSDTLAELNRLGGARLYLDGVAFHYYSLRPEWPTILEKAAEIRGIMASHGVGDLPLLCPEMGYGSSDKWGSSEQEQAHQLVQTFMRGVSVGLQQLSWYKVFDDVVPGEKGDTGIDKTSGLLRVDGSPKVAYDAYRTMTRELNTLHYQGTLQAAGAEGYVFGKPGGRTTTVLWALSKDVQVTFAYSHLRLVDTEGAEFDIWDGQAGIPGDRDGQVDGKIVLDIYKNRPFYVEQK